jgi:hypothetical protein
MLPRLSRASSCPTRLRCQRHLVSRRQNRVCVDPWPLCLHCSTKPPWPPGAEGAAPAAQAPAWYSKDGRHPSLRHCPIRNGVPAAAGRSAIGRELESLAAPGQILPPQRPARRFTGAVSRGSVCLSPPALRSDAAAVIQFDWKGCCATRAFI